MERVDGYVHQQGSHCGAAALRNVSEHYGWGDSEGACFGVGGGPAFVLYDHPDQPWVTFRTSPSWLERAFFERFDIPHLHRSGDDIETAWADVTGFIDENDPVIVFLDPEPLEYLGGHHLPPHTAVVVGYDDDQVVLSDGAVMNEREVPWSAFEAAWHSDRIFDLECEYLAITRTDRTRNETDGVAAGLRQAATYALEPLQVKRDARGPGEEGLPALRSFADYLGQWADLPDPARPVEAAQHAIEGDGEGAAGRALYADALEELGQRTNLDHAIAGRMRDVAGQWEHVGAQLGEIAEADEPHPGAFEEVSALVSDIADREEVIFEDLRGQLGG